MNYQFPTIEHIDDVLPHIEGRDEFIIAEKGDYKVINYVVTMPDTFGDPNTLTGAIRRECRGLIFSTRTGKIIRRPFHKFFNLGEREETMPTQIDLSRSHVVMDKLDGSMIAPFIVNDCWHRLGTKMGITDISMQAEVFAASDKHYGAFISFMLMGNYTPVFEWCSKQQRIVLDYDQDNLVLLAVRHNITGEYMPYEEMCAEARKSNIPVVSTIGNNDNIQELSDTIRKMTGIEGYVVSFENGHKIKIKTEQYVRIHKVLDLIRTDRHIANLALNDEIDDVVFQLPDEFSDRVRKYEKLFWGTFIKKHQYLLQISREAIAQYSDDRKSVALKFVPQYHNFDRAFIFKYMDGKELWPIMIQFVQGKLGNERNYEGMWDWLGQHNR